MNIKTYIINFLETNAPRLVFNSKLGVFTNSLLVIRYMNTQPIQWWINLLQDKGIKKKIKALRKTLDAKIYLIVAYPSGYMLCVKSS